MIQSISEVSRKFAVPCLLALLCVGCKTVRETTPARTATEQLLLGTAADHATEDRFFQWLAGKKVFVDDKYFECFHSYKILFISWKRTDVPELQKPKTKKKEQGG